jgi:hypothetical protein
MVDAVFGMFGYKKNVTIFMKIDEQNYTYFEPEENKKA